MNRYTLDVRSLAWCRVCLAIAGLVYLTLLPGPAVPATGYSIFTLSDHSVFRILLVGITTLALLLLALGYRTRISAAFCWVLIASAGIAFPVPGVDLLFIALLWPPSWVVACRRSPNRRRWCC